MPVLKHYWKNACLELKWLIKNNISIKLESTREWNLLKKWFNLHWASSHRLIINKTIYQMNSSPKSQFLKSFQHNFSVSLFRKKHTRKCRRTKARKCSNSSVNRFFSFRWMFGWHLWKMICHKHESDIEFYSIKSKQALEFKLQFERSLIFLFNR